MDQQPLAPCDKPAYTKKQAQTLRNYRTKGRCRMRHGRPKHLRIYQCPDCGYWHLTSKP